MLPRFAHILLILAMLLGTLPMATPAQAGGPTHAPLQTEPVAEPVAEPITEPITHLTSDPATDLDPNPLDVCANASAYGEVPSGEWITIHPPLRMDGEIYEVSYRRTSSYSVATPIFFWLLDEEFMKQQGITGLRVTNGEEEVTDPVTVSKVFLLYRAAYHLYETPKAIPIPPDNPELDTVLKATWLLTLATAATGKVEEMRGEAYDDLWRAILTPQGEKTAPLLDEAFGPNWEQKITDREALITLFEQAANSSGAAQKLAESSGVLAEALRDVLEHTPRAADVTLPVLTAAAKVAFLWLAAGKTQEERAEWLSDYLEGTAPEGPGPDAEQRAAAQRILQEVQDNKDHRLERTKQILATALLEEGFKIGVFKGLPALAKILGSKTASGLLANTGLVLTLTAAWYSADAWYSDFTLAQRALALRAALAAGNAELRRKAQTERTERTAIAGGEEQPYDGDRAAVYRDAFLLETMAAVESQRRYSEGYEAIFRVPNFLSVIERTRQTPQREAARSAKVEAEQLESENLAYFSPLTMQHLLYEASPQGAGASGSEFAQSGGVEGSEGIIEVKTSGDRLYAVAKDAIYVYSLVEPDVPELLARLPLDPELTLDADVYGRCVFVLDTSELVAIDVGDLAVPKVLRRYEVGWVPRGYLDLAVGPRDGSVIAYLAYGGDSEGYGDGGLSYGDVAALDLSGHMSGQASHLMQAMGWPAATKIADPYFFLGLSTGKHGNVGGFRRLSSDGESAIWDVNVELPESVLAIETAGPYVYLGGSYWGSGHIWVMDVSDPEQPRQITSLDYGQTSSLVRWGGTLFASTDAGLVALDLHDPAAPKEVAILPDVELGRIAAAQDRLYIVTRNGIVIVNMGSLAAVPVDLPPGAGGGQIDSGTTGETGGAAEAPPAGEGQRMSVLVENLNVRSGPGRDFMVLAQADTGEELAVTGRSADGAWLAVCCVDGVSGWVIADPQYIRFGGDVTALPVQEMKPSSPAGADAPATVDDAAVCPIVPAGALTAAGAGLGCAQGEASITWAAYTPFEGGFILWRRDTGRIYGFFDDGTWRSVPDAWDGSSPTPSRGSPPGGLREPVRGAGWVWGTNDDFFSRLGWGTGEQTGFCAEVQTFEEGFALRSSTVARCDADNGNPVQSGSFLYFAARDDGGWATK